MKTIWIVTLWVKQDLEYIMAEIPYKAFTAEKLARDFMETHKKGNTNFELYQVEQLA